MLGVIARPPLLVCLNTHGIRWIVYLEGKRAHILGELVVFLYIVFRMVGCLEHICYFSPAAKGGNPKISGIVFFSLDYSSLGCI